MTERWCWFSLFDIKLRTFMNYESEMKKMKHLESKVLAWDIAEMIAYRCAEECLETGYYD